MRKQENYDYGKLPLFDGINPEEVDGLMGCLSGHVREFKKNEYIIMDEDEARYVCVVLEGCVHMLKEDEEGHRSFLIYIQPGELFDESFALRRIRRSKVSFLAARRTVALFLPFSKVMNMCSNGCCFHQRMIENMYELLTVKNLFLMQKIDIVSKERLRDKVLAYLKLQLTGDPGMGASRGIEILGDDTVRIPLNKSELAHYLNVNRTSLCRELTLMEEEQLIAVDGDTYKVLG